MDRSLKYFFPVASGLVAATFSRLKGRLRCCRRVAGTVGLERNGLAVQTGLGGRSVAGDSPRPENHRIKASNLREPTSNGLHPSSNGPQPTSSNLPAMASKLLAMASKLLAMASNLEAMASNLLSRVLG